MFKQKQKEKDKQKDDQLVWFIVIDGEARGPLSLRDIDVLLRTNEISSRMLGCNTSSKEWKPLSEIDQLKEYIGESSKEMVEIGKRIIQTKQQIQQQKEQEKNRPDETDEFLNTAVEGLMVSQIFKGEDGKWNIYDQEKQTWSTQNEQPTQKIQTLKKTLLEQLKSQLFATTSTKGHHNDKKPPPVLTKQQLQKKEKNKKKTKRNAEKKKQKWYNPRINTFIYVTGLPLDTTEEEIKDFVSKAGILRVDPETQKDKIKLYKNEDGTCKGDAIVSYAKEESVDLAIDVLNEREFKPGYIVKIERAHFNQKKDEYIPREGKKVNKIDKVIASKHLEKHFDWADQSEGLGLKIVILKNMFTLQDVKDDKIFQQFQLDIKEELERIGPVVRVKFFDTHPDGIVEVKFKEDKDAEECVSLMDGRFFDGREVECFYWDGETDYKLNREAVEAEGKRIEDFGKWLEEKVEGQEQKGEAEVINQGVEENQQNQIKLTLQDLQDL